MGAWFTAIRVAWRCCIAWASKTSAREACRPARMRPGRPPSSRDTTNCSTGWPPTRSSTSPMLHPEYQSRPAHGWVRKGDKVALRRTSGRQRLNLHAALNLENFHCPLVEAERIDAASTIALLAKLEASNPGKRRIYVIVDNARLSSCPCGPAVAGETRLPHHARLPAPPMHPISTPSRDYGLSCTAK